MRSKTKKFPLAVVKDAKGAEHEAVFIKLNAQIFEDASQGIAIIDDTLHEVKKTAIGSRKTWYVDIHTHILKLK